MGRPCKNSQNYYDNVSNINEKLYKWTTLGQPWSINYKKEPKDV